MPLSIREGWLIDYIAYKLEIPNLEVCASGETSVLKEHGLWLWQVFHHHKNNKMDAFQRKLYYVYFFSWIHPYKLMASLVLDN